MGGSSTSSCTVQNVWCAMLYKWQYRNSAFLPVWLVVCGHMHIFPMLPRQSLTFDMLLYVDIV